MDENTNTEQAKEALESETNDNISGATDNEAETTEEIASDDPSTLLKLNEVKLADANDKYLRLYSEFENYKRRTSKERIEMMQTAGKEFFISVLPVLDDFERAIKAIPVTVENEAVTEGVNLIYHKLLKTLNSKGLEAMEVKEKLFDAEIHEAITSIPAPSENLKGKIVDELEKGYLLNGKVIRYAKVVVGA